MVKGRVRLLKGVRPRSASNKVAPLLLQGAPDPLDPHSQHLPEVVVPGSPDVEIARGLRELAHPGTLHALHLRKHRENVGEGRQPLNAVRLVRDLGLDHLCDVVLQCLKLTSGED
eukprot:6163207-Pyramimonas_sp.AAC.1